MQLNDTQKMAIQFNKMAREKLEDRVEEFTKSQLFYYSAKKSPQLMQAIIKSEK